MKRAFFIAFAVLASTPGDGHPAFGTAAGNQAWFIAALAAAGIAVALWLAARR